MVSLCRVWFLANPQCVYEDAADLLDSGNLRHPKQQFLTEQPVLFIFGRYIFVNLDRTSRESSRKHIVANSGLRSCVEQQIAI